MRAAAQTREEKKEMVPVVIIGNCHRSGWGRSGKPYNARWLHGDMKDMAYFYVYPLFYKLQGKVSPNEANTD